MYNLYVYKGTFVGVWFIYKVVLLSGIKLKSESSTDANYEIHSAYYVYVKY
jgi:hypothetical protein